MSRQRLKCSDPTLCHQCNKNKLKPGDTYELPSGSFENKIETVVLLNTCALGVPKWVDLMNCIGSITTEIA